MIPHLCKNDAGARKNGCKACVSRYNREYNRKRPRPRKVRPSSLPVRVLGALRLGFPLSLYQIWRMIGCPPYKSIRRTCFCLQKIGSAQHERIPKAGSKRGMCHAMRWEAV